MSIELEERQRAEVKETEREIRFRCRICGTTRPLSQLREIRRFFPPLIACSDCEEKMCGSGKIIRRTQESR
jgi:hypothetical protein